MICLYVFLIYIGCVANSTWKTTMPPLEKLKRYECRIADAKIGIKYADDQYEILAFA